MATSIIIGDSKSSKSSNNGEKSSSSSRNSLLRTSSNNRRQQHRRFLIGINDDNYHRRVIDTISCCRRHHHSHSHSQKKKKKKKSPSSSQQRRITRRRRPIVLVAILLLVAAAASELLLTARPTISTTAFASAFSAAPPPPVPAPSLCTRSTRTSSLKSTSEINTRTTFRRMASSSSSSSSSLLSNSSNSNSNSNNGAKNHYGSLLTSSLSSGSQPLSSSSSLLKMTKTTNTEEETVDETDLLEVDEEHHLSQQQQSEVEAKSSPSPTPVVVGPKILELAVPALGALLIDPLLTIADTAFVGRYASSPSELAGMGSATALLTFSFYIFNFLCTATTPLVAQKRASAGGPRQESQEALQVGGQALSLALALGTVLSLGLILCGQPLLEVMGTSVTGPLANKYAMDFLVVRSLAAPAVFTISASTGILRGYLDTKTPIVVLLAANVINFTLDVIFIVWFKLGPMGAALATTTAEWISAILFLLVLAGKLPSMDGELGKKKIIVQEESVERTERDDTAPLLSTGEDATTATTTTTLVVTPSLSIPPWGEIRPLVVASSAVFLRSTVLQLFLSSAAAFAARSPTGAESSISAHQIAFQLWMLCSYTSDALAAASQALVADAIGRDDLDDVQNVSRAVFVYSSVLGIFLGTLLYVGFDTNFLFDVFTNDEGTQLELLAISTLLVLSQPLNSLVFAADGVLQGAAEFPYQAKTMAMSAVVAVGAFMIFQSIDPSTEELIHVWDAIIILQAMRGMTSAFKICDENGPIRILSPANKNV